MRDGAEGPAQARRDFVFARSSAAHRGGQRTLSGEVPLCVDPHGSFAVDSPSTCSQMGLVQRGFKPVKIDNAQRLDDAFPRGRESTTSRASPRKAPACSGCWTMRAIDTVPIDGFLGRKSRAAIDAFLAARKLPPAQPTDSWK